MANDYNKLSYLSEIENSDKIFLLSEDVAKYVSLSPQNIREQAKSDPKKLGFNVVVAGTQVRIPRIPFLEFLKGRTT